MILVVFSLASIDSSPVSTDSSAVSTDSSLLAFLLLEPSPLQFRCTLVNKMNIFFVFWNSLFHFIWKKYSYFKKTFINSENKYFCWKNKVDANPRLPSSHFNATGCRLWSKGSDRSHSSVVNSTQKGASEIAVVQISRTEYMSRKCYHNIVDQIPQKRIFRPWNQWESHCLHRRPHIWNSCTSGASRHHGVTGLYSE